MLVIVPFLNNNSAMAQEYDKYGDSSYSQYPTDDKKYECKTGPFEGFFVSSVEFCKHVKFDNKDDRKDNRTGTQGPPGPQGHAGPAGPTGATGPQGPSGFNGTEGPRGFNGTDGAQGPEGPSVLNGSRFYERFGDGDEVPPLTSTAICDQGDSVTGGGYFTGTSNIIVVATSPGVNEFGVGGDRWTVEGVRISSTGGAGVLTAVAQCFDNPPLR